MNRDRKILGSPRTWGLPVMQLETQMGLMLQRAYEKAPPIYEFWTMQSLDFCCCCSVLEFCFMKRGTITKITQFSSLQAKVSNLCYRRGGPKVG